MYQIVNVTIKHTFQYMGATRLIFSVFTPYSVYLHDIYDIYFVLFQTKRQAMCLDDAHCIPGQMCILGECMVPTNEDCTTDAHCLSGFVCSYGKFHVSLLNLKNINNWYISIVALSYVTGKSHCYVALMWRTMFARGAAKPGAEGVARGPCWAVPEGQLFYHIFLIKQSIELLFMLF